MRITELKSMIDYMAQDLENKILEIRVVINRKQYEIDTIVCENYPNESDDPNPCFLIHLKNENEFRL